MDYTVVELIVILLETLTSLYFINKPVGSKTLLLYKSQSANDERLK